MKQSIKNNLLTVWKGWGVPILVALVLATSIKSAVADWYVVPTGSMNPTIVEGDRIFVNKLAYDLKLPYTTWHLAEWGTPCRGDIVVFYSPEDETRLIKRVIGLPGDTIEMKNNRLFINGEKMAYEKIGESTVSAAPLSDYLLEEDLTGRRHSVQIIPNHPAIRSFGPLTVPDESYFMMGDNRDNSKDSRYIGFVDRDRVVGKALSVVISLDIDNRYKPRWGRFFTELL
jgi:signal peptidase I